MQLTKVCATGLALTIAAASMVSTAEARHRHHHGYPLAAGALGFAAGAFFGNALAPRYYYDDYPAYYYDRPGYYYREAPRVYYREAPPVYYRQEQRDYSICDTPGSKPAWAMC